MPANSRSGRSRRSSAVVARGCNTSRPPLDATRRLFSPTFKFTSPRRLGTTSAPTGLARRTPLPGTTAATAHASARGLHKSWRAEDTLGEAAARQVNGGHFERAMQTAGEAHGACRQNSTMQLVPSPFQSWPPIASLPSASPCEGRHTASLPPCKVLK